MLKKKLSLKSESASRRPGNVNFRFENFLDQEGFGLFDLEYALDDHLHNIDNHVEHYDELASSGGAASREVSQLTQLVLKTEDQAAALQKTILQMQAIVKRNPKLDY